MAGVIGRYFRIDPVFVLKSDYFEWATRVAAMNHAVNEENKAAKSKSSGSSRGIDPRMNHLM